MNRPPAQEHENLPSFKTPQLVWKFDPSVKLKLRRHFYPLALTKLTLGADLDLQQGYWTFHTAWKDRIIGGSLGLKNDEVFLVKEFIVDQKNTLNFQVSYNWKSNTSLFSFRFRPYRGIQTNTQPPGVGVRRKIPLDSRTKIEVFTWFQFPEATIEAVSGQRIAFGTGDFIVHVRELNLYFELKNL
eukprot:jgi/Galph1/3891/GphlegSOOS_G2566.1